MIDKEEVPRARGCSVASIQCNAKNTFSRKLLIRSKPSGPPIVQCAMIRFGGDTQKNSEVGFVRLVDQLIAYEEGQITQDEEVAFFERLVETGVCWQLSGHYQRVTATLIEAGLIKLPEQTEASI